MASSSENIYPKKLVAIVEELGEVCLYETVIEESDDVLRQIKLSFPFTLECSKGTSFITIEGNVYLVGGDSIPRKHEPMGSKQVFCYSSSDYSSIPTPQLNVNRFSPILMSLQSHLFVASMVWYPSTMTMVLDIEFLDTKDSDSCWFHFTPLPLAQFDAYMKSEITAYVSVLNPPSLFISVSKVGTFYYQGNDWNLMAKELPFSGKGLFLDGVVYAFVDDTYLTSYRLAEDNTSFQHLSTMDLTPSPSRLCFASLKPLPNNQLGVFRIIYADGLFQLFIESYNLDKLKVSRSGKRLRNGTFGTLLPSWDKYYRPIKSRINQCFFLY